MVSKHNGGRGVKVLILTIQSQLVGLSGHPKDDLLEVEICEKKANFLLCHKLPRKLLITIAARRLSNESKMGARQQTELFFCWGNHWGITYDISI